MITPLDIQNKQFQKAMRGYKEDEVDGFLDLLTLDMEKMIQENKRMKESIKTLTSEVEHYRSAENSVLNTLEAAKALMNDISASAEKRAEILLKNAELDAERIQREAKESVERLTEEAFNLQRRWSMFKTRYRGLLETELERFDNLSADLFPEKEMEEFKPFAHETAEAGAEKETAKQVIQAPDYADKNSRANMKTIINLRMGDEV